MAGSVGMQCKLLYGTSTASADYTVVSNLTSIGQLTSMSPSITGGEADVSHADLTNLYEEYVPTLGGVQITGEVMWDQFVTGSTTSGHEFTLLDQLFVRQTWAVQWYDNASATATNNSMWYCTDSFLRDVDISGGIREPFTASIAIRLSGTPDYKGI